MTDTRQAPPMQPPPELIEVLLSCRRPLVISHIAPDGDAVGSLLGLGYLLFEMGKEPTLACQDRVPVNLRFLPDQDKIVNVAYPGEHDLIISVDSSDPTRMGDIYDGTRTGRIPLAVIDHHITNVYFGDINWVEPQACATAEMIYWLGERLNIPLSPAVATCLLTGLITDTRGFRTANVTAAAMAIVIPLMEAGAPLNQITQSALDTRSFQHVRLWGRVLESVGLEEDVISVNNTLEMRVDIENIIRVDGMASFILGTDEAQVAIVFTELPEGKIECSFRAKPGNDVATIAFEFGGGGHPLAAGCTIQGDLESVRTQVLQRFLTRND